MEKRRKKAQVRIGTSGWMYKDWGVRFYPPDLKKGHLSYLAREFDTVEVNSSFYHLPLASTFKKWRDETPEEFAFAVKLSRYITHQKKARGHPPGAPALLVACPRHGRQTRRSADPAPAAARL